MELFDILLGIHIAGGGISLLLGTYLLIVKKGDKRHRDLGNIYFWALLIASLVAIPMCYLHPNLFLFIVSIFTTYMLLTGKRYLKKKSFSDVQPADWLLTGLMMLAGLAFVVYGGLLFYQKSSFGTVLVVFGIISLLLVREDYLNFTGKSPLKNFYLVTHIGRMMGSYIASATAFLVVNNTYLPGVVAWLLPTVCVVPLIVVWSRRWAVRA